METKNDGKFWEIFKDILGYPPYLIFVFVGTVFISISLVQMHFFDQVWIFFLYSVAGSVWRYIEKDIDGGLSRLVSESKRNICHLVVIFIYHIGNLALFYALLRYLKLI